MRPNFKEINKDYKELVPKIIARFTSESPQSILNKIKEKNETIMKFDGIEVKLNINHLVIEEQVPENYQSAEGKNWNLYLNKDVNEELLSEGFSRELIRRIQMIRKDLGLNKLDRIDLDIDCSDKLKDYFNNNLDLIKEKVGTDEINFVNDLEEFKEFKIKDEIVKIIARNK